MIAKRVFKVTNFLLLGFVQLIVGCNNKANNNIKTKEKNLKTIEESRTRGYDEKSKQIFVAIATEDIEDLVYFVKIGVDITKTINQNGESVLEFATCNKNYKSLELILELENKQKDKKQKIHRDAALMCAIGSEDEKATEILLKYGTATSFENTLIRQPVHIAAKNDYIGILNVLTANGANINATNKDGRTPLYYAAKKRQHKAVKFLIKNYANPNIAEKKYGWTPLHVSTCIGQEDKSIVTQLLTNKANPSLFDKKGRTPLHCASGRGLKMLIPLLLQYNADINAVDNFGRTPIEHAAFHNKKWTIRYLAKNNADINFENKYFQTPLFVAAKAGNVEAVEELLLNGARINQASVQNTEGTPILVASKYGKIKVINVLLKNGADIESKNYEGKTPLMLSIEHDHTHVAEFLIDKGADVNVQALNGQTPLHIAAMEENAEIVEKLLKNGADKKKRDSKNKTPSHYAKGRKNDRIFAMVA